VEKTHLKARLLLQYLANFVGENVRCEGLLKKHHRRIVQAVPYDGIIDVA
jgi:hypothetical protein